MLKKAIKRFVYTILAFWIKKKTKLSKTQSYELAASLFPLLYTLNSLHFRRNRVFLRVMFDGMNWKQFALTEQQFRKALPAVTEVPDYREALGLWFTIDSEETYADAPQIQNTDSVTYYASGREPLLAIAAQVSPERKIALLPYFICHTVCQPFLENGWQIVHYKVSKDLLIDTQDVEAQYEKYKPAIAVFMEYSGMDLTAAELETIGKLQRAGCVTVVDRTQNIYSDRRDSEIDFYCGSLRKWFCCPDGAYLEKNGSIPLPPPPKADAYNDVYATACGAMMFANGLARKTKINQYLQIGYLFRQLSMRYVCSQPVRLRNMSAYSRAVYLQERSKDQEYISQRTKNFEYIFHRISSFSTMQPVCSDLSRFTSAPFYFLIYAENMTDLAYFLNKKQIIAWIHMSKASCMGELDAQTEYMFEHNLSFSCDQRYTLEDMKVLCDALEEYEVSNRKNSV